MLSVLRFKKSLFTGVLDGGETEIFLGGTRLKRFMDSVEKTTEMIPAAAQEPVLPEEVEEAISSGTASDQIGEFDGPLPAKEGTAAASADPWSGLLETGLALLQGIAQAAKAPAKPGRSAASSQNLPAVERDSRTGSQYLRVPMPAPEVLDRALKSLAAVLQGLGR
jgi:hypothetical protein